MGCASLKTQNGKTIASKAADLELAPIVRDEICSTNSLTKRSGGQLSHGVSQPHITHIAGHTFFNDGRDSLLT
jgi:hypothetical protein